MLTRLFPRQIDNAYRGNRFALWLFVPIVALKLTISLAAIFAADGGAQSADGIPLDTYPAAAARAVIGVGAFLGLADLWLALLFVLALLRYRAMIPLMYAVIVADFIAHKGIGFYKPIVRMAGTATGSYVTWSLFAISVLGLVLSLRGEGYRTRA